MQFLHFISVIPANPNTKLTWHAGINQSQSLLHPFPVRRVHSETSLILFKFSSSTVQETKGSSNKKPFSPKYNQFIRFQSEMQIKHYVNTKKCHLYYLSRLNKFGVLRMPSVTLQSQHTVSSLSRIFIMKMVNTFHGTKDKTSHFQLLYDNLLMENNDLHS